MPEYNLDTLNYIIEETKENIAEIKSKLEQCIVRDNEINQKLAGVEGRMTAIETDLAEERQAREQARREAKVDRRWLIGTCIGVAISIIGWAINSFIK